MSYRNWLPEIGIGLGLIIAILLALNFAELVSSKKITANNEIKQETAKQQAAEESAKEPQFRVSPITPTNPAADKHGDSGTQNAQPQADNHLLWGDGYAQWSMAGTGFLALIVSAWGVWLLYGTLKATAGALEMSQQQLIASQRPWLKITMEVTDDVSFNDGIMRTSVRFTINNIGNYPARNIWLDAEIFPSSYGPGGNYRAYLENLIQSSKLKKTISVGQFLFANQDFSMTFDYEIEKTKITEAMGHKGYIDPVIVGCVCYEFDNSPRGHHSAFVRDLVHREIPRPKITDRNRPEDVIFPNDGKISRSHIAIVSGVHSADYAN